MRYFIIIILCILFFKGTAQLTSWSGDSLQHANFRSRFLAKIDTVKIIENDLQIRLWFSNSWGRISITSLINLTYKDKSWSADYFTFSKPSPSPDSTLKVERLKVISFDLDSLYSQLLSDSIFTLNSSNIGSLLDKRNLKRSFWTDGGPQTYKIEIVTVNNNKVLYYPCPQLFYEEYKIDEFKIPLKIIKTLLHLINANPC